ncbi:MAG: branched-chain amino acid ABC transporter permease [Candidatus Planktophila sp.]|nr:branched-chain amino acid ABC transporter permease [Candidatus Planktophila sp.]MSO25194.1 branched-chain amino acid ABC transporter permease [Candidatus Planktophila sp.]
MNTFLAALSLGTSRGAIFALVALGLVIVWRGAGIVNFAQMGQAMFSTYIASTLIANGYSYWVAFLAALLSGAALGALLDIFIMRPLSNKKQSELLSSESMRAAVPVIASLGILGALQALAGIIWAAEERGFPAPAKEEGFTVAGNVLPFTSFDVFVVSIVTLTLIVTTLFFTKTGIGLAMRATALNQEVAKLSGIRTNRTRTISWAISGAASSLAGLLITPTSNLSPNTLDLVLIVGFTAAVVGGLDSPVGAVLGGFILGMVISFVTFYDTPEDVFLAILAVLLAVLIIRPRGILGSKDARRV